MLHLLINKEFHSAIITLFLTAIFAWITPSVFAADKATEKPDTIQTIKKTGSVTERGKLIMGGQEHDFTDIVITEGSKLWQVIVMARANNAEMKTLMQKVVDSITF